MFIELRDFISKDSLTTKSLSNLTLAAHTCSNYAVICIHSTIAYQSIKTGDSDSVSLFSEVFNKPLRTIRTEVKNMKRALSSSKHQRNSLD